MTTRKRRNAVLGGRMAVPYKAVGAKVFVKKGGKWELLKEHATPEKARRHAVALNMNTHKEGEK